MSVGSFSCPLEASAAVIDPYPSIASHASRKISNRRFGHRYHIDQWQQQQQRRMAASFTSRHPVDWQLSLDASLLSGELDCSFQSAQLLVDFEYSTFFCGGF